MPAPLRVPHTGKWLAPGSSALKPHMTPSPIKAGEEKGPGNKGENEEAGACEGPWACAGVECWRNSWRASGQRWEEG